MTISKKSILFTGLILTATCAPLLAFADGNTFVPLSGIPAFNNFKDPTSLPAVLNSLYLVCIGIAVVLSVLQLVRAGVMYSMGDSGFAKMEEAKHLIMVSLLGLLLVLSPYIVFSIINPKILDLQIGTSGLKLDSPSPTTNTNAATDTSTPAAPTSSWYCFGFLC